MTPEQQKAIETAKARAAAIANAKQRMQQTSRGAGMDFQGSVVRGLTLGLSDYPQAATRKLAGETIELLGGPQSPTFNQSLESVRGDTKRYREESPVAAYGGEIAGAVASAPANALVRTAGSIVPGVGVGSRLARYATQGGAVGGVAGLANSQSDTGGVPSLERAAVDAATGTALGAGLGVGIGGGIEAATPLVRWVSGRIAGRMPSKQPEVAAQVLAKAADRSGLSAERIAQKLEQRGPNAMLADVSPNMRAGAELAAQSPETLTIAERALGGRAAGRESRLQDVVKANISSQSYGDTVDALNKAAREKAAPLYKQLENFKLKPDLRLQRFLLHPKVREGINRAVNNIKTENLARDLPFDPTDYGLVPTGKQVTYQTQRGPVTMENFDVNSPLSLRLWDTAKGGLDDILEDFRNPLTGRKELTRDARPIQELKDALINRLDTLTDTGKAQYQLSTGEYTGSLYKRARDAWSGPAKINDAIERGRDFMKGDYEQFAKAVSRMTDAEREGVRIGVARELDEMIQKNPTNALKQLQKTFYRQRMTKVFGSRQKANEFYKQVLIEAEQAATEKAALGNSATYRRDALRQDMQGTLGEIADGSVGIATDRPIFGVPGLVRSAIDWLERPSPGVQNEIAKMLLSKDPQVKARAIEAIRVAQQQLQKTNTAAVPQATIGATVAVEK